MAGLKGWMWVDAKALNLDEQLAPEMVPMLEDLLDEDKANGLEHEKVMELGCELELVMVLAMEP